jgi:polysaccharide export outer membrane protein
LTQRLIELRRVLLRQVSLPSSGCSRIVSALFLALSLVVCAGTARAQQQGAAKAVSAQAPQAARTGTILSSSGSDGLGEYLIGPDDLLSISVLESADLTRDVRVASDGTIGLPLLAEHPHVAGLSLAQAEALLKKKYQESGVLNDPNITISLKELESRPVTVMGSVRAPGVFQVSGQVRLMRLISMAGGFGEDAGKTVQVIHEDNAGEQQVTQVKIEDIRLGQPDANVAVRGGDTVNVLPTGSVYVIGAVNKPGRFLLPSDTQQTTVLNIVAMSEDLKRTAKGSHAVLIRRKGTGGEVEEIPVDVPKILARQMPDVAVRANDVLFVPDSAAKRAFTRGLESAIQIATGVAIFAAVP